MLLTVAYQSGGEGFFNAMPARLIGKITFDLADIYNATAFSDNKI